MPRAANEYPRYATFKDVVGSKVAREVVERQIEQARLAAEWRHAAKTNAASEDEP